MSNSSVLTSFMECPCVARMNLWCFLSYISKRFLSLLSTTCLTRSSSTFLHPFLRRHVITSSRGTYPLGYIVNPSCTAPWRRIQERVFESSVSAPPRALLSFPLCIILLLYSDSRSIFVEIYWSYPTKKGVITSDHAYNYFNDQG